MILILNYELIIIIVIISTLLLFLDYNIIFLLN